ncbi:hypothetical protein JHW43_001078 [Diplocarpon mali]|nr:hypothetical protein JHW43_001078 [Diplocarpon mali]
MDLYILSETEPGFPQASTKQSGGESVGCGGVATKRAHSNDREQLEPGAEPERDARQSQAEPGRTRQGTIEAPLRAHFTCGIFHFPPDPDGKNHAADLDVPCRLFRIMQAMPRDWRSRSPVEGCDEMDQPAGCFEDEPTWNRASPREDLRVRDGANGGGGESGGEASPPASRCSSPVAGPWRENLRPLPHWTAKEVPGYVRHETGQQHRRRRTSRRQTGRSVASPRASPASPASSLPPTSTHEGFVRSRCLEYRGAACRMPQPRILRSQPAPTALGTVDKDHVTPAMDIRMVSITRARGPQSPTRRVCLRGPETITCRIPSDSISRPRATRTA